MHCTIRINAGSNGRKVRPKMRSDTSLGQAARRLFNDLIGPAICCVGLVLDGLAGVLLDNVIFFDPRAGVDRFLRNPGELRRPGFIPPFAAGNLYLSMLLLVRLFEKTLACLMMIMCKTNGVSSGLLLALQVLSALYRCPEACRP